MSPTVSPIPQAARPYQGRPAGLMSRSIAATIDLLIVVLALVAIYVGWSGLLFLLRPERFKFPEPSIVLGLAAGFVVLTLYLTAGWTMTGRTYGNHLMGLRVVNHRGKVMRLPRALLRSLLYVLFPIGLLWVAMSARNKSLQDIVLGTSVMYDWHSADPQRRTRAAGDSQETKVFPSHDVSRPATDAPAERGP
jgi:uncharacterized RDD family membrane protein YckC